MSRDHWVQLTVDREERVAPWRQVLPIHVLCHSLSHMSQWVVGLQVEVSTNVGQQMGSHIGHVVTDIFPSQHLNLKEGKFEDDFNIRSSD